MVRFGQKWLYSGKFVVIGKSSCVSAKVVLFRAKVVVFGKKWLYSGKSGCIQAKVVVIGQSGCIREKVVVFEQSGCNGAKWFIRKKLVVVG